MAIATLHAIIRHEVHYYIHLLHETRNTKHLQKIHSEHLYIRTLGAAEGNREFRASLGRINCGIQLIENVEQATI